MQQDNNNAIPSIYQHELGRVRMIVLMELEPFSNKYAQVLVNKEQFVSVMNGVNAAFLRENGSIGIRLGNVTIKLPEDLSDVQP